MSKTWRTLLVAGATTVAVAAGPALAKDKVRFIDSTKIVFEMEHVFSAKENGVFDRYGLDVDVIFGDGGAATLQTIITGSQDVAFGVGVLSVISAYAKGAPVRILGSTKRGVGDVFWYVKYDSPIKALTDLTGKELAFSRMGSTTHLAVLYLKDALNLDAKLTSVGGPAASRTQLMSGQVASGWSAFPFNTELVREKKIRIIGTGSQAAGLEGVTIRVIAANAGWLDKNRGVAQRLMAALQEGQIISYTSEKQQHAYAARWNLNYDDVKEASKFVPLVESTFLPIGNTDRLNEMALKFKHINKLLTPEQIHELIHPLGNKPS